MSATESSETRFTKSAQYRCCWSHARNVDDEMYCFHGREDDYGSSTHVSRDEDLNRNKPEPIRDPGKRLQFPASKSTFATPVDAAVSVDGLTSRATMGIRDFGVP